MPNHWMKSFAGSVTLLGQGQTGIWIHCPTITRMHACNSVELSFNIPVREVGEIRASGSHTLRTQVTPRWSLFCSRLFVHNQKLRKPNPKLVL
jgi:hypothetical protein